MYAERGRDRDSYWGLVGRNNDFSTIDSQEKEQDRGESTLAWPSSNDFLTESMVTLAHIDTVPLIPCSSHISWGARGEGGRGGGGVGHVRTRSLGTFRFL